VPVYKFRTLQEASVALWASPDDPRLPNRVRSWWRSCATRAVTHSPRGLRKFRSIEEANTEQATWRVETFMKLGESEPGATT
jgi:DNA-directed RNA polymerase specialized sigma24 family protein